ncbi:MAG: zinc ribbon domain-containing protein [bacterium]
MATSTGKTIGLIFIILLILLAVGRLTPWLFAPLGIFPGFFNFLRVPPSIEGIGCWTGGFVRFVPLLILTVLWIAVIVWVYKDAERRGMNGILWALLVFIGNLIALLIYLIVRSDNLPTSDRTLATRPCSNCQKPVTPNYVFCPHCGTRLQAVCPKCERPIEDDWQVCPSCGEKLKKGRSK